MIHLIRRLVTWLLDKLGLLSGRGLLWPSTTLPDPNAPEFQPVVNENHHLFTAEVERLDVKRCIRGEAQWFTMIAFDQLGGRLGEVELRWELERAGVGTVMDMPNWMGETRESDGACRFFHAQRPARYRLIVEDVWLVENIRTDLPWKCYANGYCTHADVGTFQNPGRGGWLVVLKPGRFAYWVIIHLKGEADE